MVRIKTHAPTDGTHAALKMTTCLNGRLISFSNRTRRAHIAAFVSGLCSGCLMFTCFIHSEAEGYIARDD